MQDIRQKKQKYLRQNILDKNYDAEQFMDFCQNLKGSIDIDSWTFQELQQMVQKYIISPTHSHLPQPNNFQNIPTASTSLNIDWDSAFSQIQKIKQQPIKKDISFNLIDFDFLQNMGSSGGSSPTKTQSKQIENKTNIHQKINKDLKLNKQYSNSNANKQSNIQDEWSSSLNCKSFSTKSKLIGQIQVNVTGHQIVNPNPFVPNFVLYQITLYPICKEVKRRLKDFESYRLLLKKIFPSTQIPHLQRCGRLSETEPAVIKKQKQALQNFLNSVLMNPLLRCKITDDFLMVESLDAFKKVFRQYQKMQKPKGIQQLYTLDGSVKLILNHQFRKALTHNTAYLDCLQASLSKLKDLYDSLALSLAQTVKTITQISQIYDMLKQSTATLNTQLPEQYKALELQIALLKIQQLHKQWGSFFKTQGKAVQSQIRQMYRYQMSNLQTIRQILKNGDNIVQNYLKRGDKDSSQKQQYQYNKRLNEYKIGVDIASKHPTVLKYQASYYIQNCCGESRRFFYQLSKKVTKQFRVFSALQLSIGNQLGQQWKQYQTLK